MWWFFQGVGDCGQVFRVLLVIGDMEFYFQGYLVMVDGVVFDVFVGIYYFELFQMLDVFCCFGEGVVDGVFDVGFG